jgi:nitroimidazol reductase NimA-like FMN-containing flavoprotein (pyridoxamine 5'-phosphate oxidase superfamily)
VNNVNKQDSGGPAAEETPKTAVTGKVADRIRRLVENQPYGVLCTQLDGQPYGSMVALAYTDDLRCAVFATQRATRKYRNLTEGDKVAIVANDLDQHPDELMKVVAFTATGRAAEVRDEEETSRWASLLARRHPHLQGFIESPSTAVFKVEIVRYFFVHSFQEVIQWVPAADNHDYPSPDPPEKS